MSGVAGDEAGSVEVDAALLAADEQVGALAHGSGAVDVRRGERSGAVGGTRMNLKAIIASRNADEGREEAERQCAQSC